MQTSNVFSPVAQLLGDGGYGTVEASVVVAEHGYFGLQTVVMESGGPLHRAAAGSVPAPFARSKASDLVAELREIGSQVSRMMSQVERAIDRFAVHAG